MSELPGARQSPRIENGILHWYKGDTFQLDIALELADQDGEAVAPSANAVVTVTFRDRSRCTVKTFSFSAPTGGTVTLSFDADCTALFDRGEYDYDVVLTDGKVTTVGSALPAVVE